MEATNGYLKNMLYKILQKSQNLIKNVEVVASLQPMWSIKEEGWYYETSYVIKPKKSE